MQYFPSPQSVLEFSTPNLHNNLIKSTSVRSPSITAQQTDHTKPYFVLNLKVIMTVIARVKLRTAALTPSSHTNLILVMFRRGKCPSRKPCQANTSVLHRQYTLERLDAVPCEKFYLALLLYLALQSHSWYSGKY